MRFALFLLFATSLLGSDRGAGPQSRATIGAQRLALPSPALCADGLPAISAIPPLPALVQQLDDAAAQQPAHPFSSGLVPRLAPAKSFQLAGLIRAPPHHPAS